jgi:hypothetical protein
MTDAENAEKKSGGHPETHHHYGVKRFVRACSIHGLIIYKTGVGSRI